MSLKLSTAKLLMQFSDNRAAVRSLFTESMTAAREAFLQNGRHSPPHSTYWAHVSDQPEAPLLSKPPSTEESEEQ